MRSCLFKILGFIVVFWAKQHFRIGFFIVGLVANISAYALAKIRRKDARKQRFADD